MPTRRHVLAAGLLTPALLLGGCSSPAPQRAAPSTAPAPPSSSPPSPEPTPEPPPRPELGASGVSSGHPLASRAGMQVLEAGGNAVDAVVATAFADAVLQPASSGIGGGGAAIVVIDGVATNWDYREVVNRAGEVPSSGAGIPGFVAGMQALHDEHGSLPWGRLLEPAIRLAAEGVPVSGFLAGAIGGGTGQRATGPLEQFRRAGGGPLREGDQLVQAELAETMRTLARDGGDAFYRGALTPALAAMPGIDAASLDAYALQVSAPAEGPVAGFTLVSGAPALPGAAIVQMVQIAEAAGIGSVEPGSPEFIDLQSRAWQVADDAVQTWFGDPAFVDVPVADLTDPRRNAEIAAGLWDAREASAASAAADGYEGAPNTTHISVVDDRGRAVSMTNTITNYWGSGQYVAGFFLNDQLGRFDDVGRTGSNDPAPGRRSVTWSSPSMLLDDRRRPVLVIGTPGGRQIPNTTASVVMRWALHGQDLATAVPADRFMLTGGELRLESDRHAAAMRALGYDVSVTDPGRRESYGSVQALAVDWATGAVTGEADERRSAGFEVTGPAGSP